MKDILLGIIIDMAEKEAFPEVDITLIVGGFVVSGYIISGKKFFEHNEITRILYESAKDTSTEDDKKLIKDEKSVADEPASKYEFIHLRDAQYFSDGRSSIPSNGGVYTRIKIEDVSGFNFGKITKMNTE
ncbi:gas vesicle accessory protein GvpU [Desulfomicrobium baculatum]|uniref:Uncharacterized protein n=1 Tax=Desulfomicrobium baculatum (strain DSM 4028 / VKM B-1378 / X) TaxID=525897 RepID=C7LNI4_DESBD|nr:gas vesicle accessory protein GvpU [Desulfomicrobium baculatum]ACU88869.1 conserved hypothetical protein [Desulfomicrobium baculatum DSM 4028]